MASKPTIPQVAPLVQALYARPGGEVGCCLHVVLDDGNVRDDYVQVCLDMARVKSHRDCEEIAGLLLQMSKTQRIKLGKLPR